MRGLPTEQQRYSDRQLRLFATHGEFFVLEVGTTLAATFSTEHVLCL